MKKILFLLSFILSYSCLWAQDAKDILNKAADTYTTEGAIKLNFTIITQNVGDDIVHSQDGIAYMYLDKFQINIPEATAWFNGTTQWIYVKDLDEISITNPTGADLMAISPTILLKIYEQGYNVSLVGETKNNGSTVYEIAMKPNKPETSIGVINVQIDKQTNRIKQIKINNEGLENTFLINRYDLVQDIDKKIFDFDPLKYPQAEIVDLR